MLRRLLVTTALLTLSGAAFAGDGYGRVISVEPQFTISFGTRHHDGFRVLYESGGHRYWTHTHAHPGSYIVLPPQPVHYSHPGGHGYDHRKDRHGYLHDDHRGHGYHGYNKGGNKRHGRHHWD